MIDPYLKQYVDQLKKVCKKYEVKRLYAFGSVVDGRFKKGESDIDFLIEFDSKIDKRTKAKALLHIWMRFQSILNCKIDLITNDQVEGKHFKKYLDLYKVRIFNSSDID